MQIVLSIVYWVDWYERACAEYLYPTFHYKHSLTVGAKFLYIGFHSKKSIFDFFSSIIKIQDEHLHRFAFMKMNLWCGFNDGVENIRANFFFLNFVQWIENWIWIARELIWFTRYGTLVREMDGEISKCANSHAH